MKYKIKKSKDNQYYFTVVADNGRVLVTSETYKQKQSAEKAIEAIKKGAKSAKIKEE